MWNPFNHPFLILGVSFVIFWISSQIGALLRARRSPSQGDEHEDFTFILGATLTLLGLIIGFTFSMAVNRYDQRKNYEEAEANAIGTEYLRADFLPAPAAQRVRGLLRSYLDARIDFYVRRDSEQLRQIDARTAQLQSGLWAEVQAAAQVHETPIAALVVSGMNDVLSSQSYTQAAWWYRIPTAAWALMVLIAIACNVLVGYVASQLKSRTALLLVLPSLLTVAFFLISDIDTPRGGIIHVGAPNLTSLAASLR
jgi:hypothetical protein